MALGLAARRDQNGDEQDERPGDGQVEQMPGGQEDRRSGHVAVQLGEGDERAGEGHRADGHAEAEFDQALQFHAAALGDAIGSRGVDGGYGHQTGGEPHQGVERGHQLRKRCHLDL